MHLASPQTCSLQAELGHGYAMQGYKHVHNCPMGPLSRLSKETKYHYQNLYQKDYSELFPFYSLIYIFREDKALILHNSQEEYLTEFVSGILI